MRITQTILQTELAYFRGSEIEIIKSGLDIFIILIWQYIRTSITSNTRETGDINFKKTTRKIK